MTASIIEHFSSLEDPRIDRKKRHLLIDIIVLTISAVASGADGWEAIEDFGKEKLDWLRQYIALENGVPSHDCIAYVLSRISPKGFRECFMRWTQSVVDATAGEVIAVDGKTARGSRDRKNNANPLHMVSAWACANRMVLGQQATDDKSNEITAIPKLLALLEIKGCIVTIDAMGCQRAIAEQVLIMQLTHPWLSQVPEGFYFSVFYMLYHRLSHRKHFNRVVICLFMVIPYHWMS